MANDVTTILSAGSIDNAFTTGGCDEVVGVTVAPIAAGDCTDVNGMRRMIVGMRVTCGLPPHEVGDTAGDPDETAVYPSGVTIELWLTAAPAGCC